MSQQQLSRPADHLDGPIKYGDVFPVQGDLAKESIRPVDASMMQKAENIATGKTQKGGAASVMQSAAKRNEQAGFVGHDEVSGEAVVKGFSVAEVDASGCRVVREAVAGQTVTQFSMPVASPPGVAAESGMITVGEALVGAAIMQNDKPVDKSDAAAIQAAEVRATGMKTVMPGGLAAAAQSAADINARITATEDKITMGDVLINAPERLPADKGVTREDAYGVVGAEIRNRPDLKTVPGGVAESVTAAVLLNETNRT